MKTHSLRYRVQLLKAKQNGYFRGTSWGKLFGSMHKPTTAWSTRDFARPMRQEESDGLMEYDTPMGVFWAPSSDREVLGGTEIEILSSVYEYGNARIESGAVVFDMGANLGTFTRRALDQGAARVVCFEPQSLYRACICRTFAREIAEKRVDVISSPVWSEKKTLHFAGASLVGHVAEEGLAMESTTLDEVVEALQLPRVDFLKADIEGAERHALMGAERLIRKWRPRVAFCVYHYPDDPAVIGGLLRAYQDYSMVFDTSGRYVYCW